MVNNYISKLGEIGKSGFKWSQGYIHEEFLSDLRGKTGIKTYREMSDNDAIVGGCLFAIKQILREARWTVKKGSSTEKNTKFLYENMSNMSHSWNEMITDILSMLIYGWSWHEIVYKRIGSRIYWKKIAIRSQTSFDHWELNDNGSVLGIWQNPAPDYSFIYIPLNVRGISKSLLFRTELAADNPMGRSILRSAYRSWYFKKGLEEIEAIGAERDLAGLPVVELPEGFDLESNDPNVTAAIAWAKKLVANIRVDEQAGLVMPHGWGFELVSAPGKRQFDVNSIINRYNKQITISMLAEFMMLGMERTGSYALSQDLIDVFHFSLEAFADSIASVFNRYAVPSLFKINGIVNQPLPYITHTRIHRYSLKDLAEYVSKLAGADALNIDDEVKDYLKSFARLSEFKEVEEKK